MFGRTSHPPSKSCPHPQGPRGGRGCSRGCDLPALGFIHVNALPSTARRQSEDCRERHPRGDGRPSPPPLGRFDEDPASASSGDVAAFGSRAPFPLENPFSSSRRVLPEHPTGAALVVLHHLGGLSLAVGRGLVASHCRTGFAEFQSRWNPASEDTWHPHTRSHQRVHTLRSFPLTGSRVASLRPLPPRRSPSHCAQNQSRDRLPLAALRPGGCGTRTRLPSRMSISPSEEGDPTWTADRLAPDTYGVRRFLDRTALRPASTHRRFHDHGPMTFSLPTLSALAPPCFPSLRHLDEVAEPVPAREVREDAVCSPPVTGFPRRKAANTHSSL